MAGTSYETLEGNNIEIGCDGESLTVNGIKMVLKKDIVTTNGVIHLIDQVLMPDSGKTHISSNCLSMIYCIHIYIVQGVWYFAVIHIKMLLGFPVHFKLSR